MENGVFVWFIGFAIYYLSFYMVWYILKNKHHTIVQNTCFLKLLIIVQYLNLVTNFFFELGVVLNILCNNFFLQDYQIVLNDTWDVTQKFVKKYKDTSFLSRLTILLVYHHLSYLLVGVHPYINYWVLILWFSHLRFMFDEQTELVILVFLFCCERRPKRKGFFASNSQSKCVSVNKYVVFFFIKGAKFCFSTL